MLCMEGDPSNPFNPFFSSCPSSCPSFPSCPSCSGFSETVPLSGFSHDAGHDSALPRLPVEPAGELLEAGPIHQLEDHRSAGPVRASLHRQVVGPIAIG